LEKNGIGGKEMALSKKIELENGVVLKYHRIHNFNLDPNKKEVVVIVKSYTHKKFRDKEKSNFDIIRQIETEKESLVELGRKIDKHHERITDLIEEASNNGTLEVEDDNQAERIKLSEEVNKMSKELTDLSWELQKLEEKKHDDYDVSVLEMTINLDYDTDKSYSLETLYGELKNIDTFAGSEDEI